MSQDDILQAFRSALGRWKGCDWPTQFGDGGLDLNGLTAAQALLMARATAGAESADWRAAARWLEEVEADARKAEEAACVAAKLIADGRLGEAAELAKLACSLEGRYREERVWRPLYEALTG